MKSTGGTKVTIYGVDIISGIFISSHINRKRFVITLQKFLGGNSANPPAGQTDYDRKQNSTYARHKKWKKRASEKLLKILENFVDDFINIF